MSKHTKGNGTEDTSAVFVITPDNIGKTIHFDQKTNKYEVKLSGAAGNLLSLREDGLYYGSKPKPELETLYVDAVNGVDQDPLTVDGAGTRANPLKTFAYAIGLTEEGKTHTIFLHESQDHVLGKVITTKQGSVSVYSYGSKFDEYMTTAIDVKEARRAHNRDGYGANLVFKGAEVLRGTNNSYYKYSFRRMKLTGRMLFMGVNLVNDVNANLSVPAGQTDVNVVTKERIFVDGSLSFDIGKLEDRGSPSVGTGVLSKVNDRWDLGHFYTTQGKVILYSIHNDVSALTTFILASKGWEFPLTSDAVLNTSTDPEKVAKLMRDVIIEDLGGGAKLVRIPSTNIPTKFFL